MKRFIVAFLSCLMMWSAMADGWVLFKSAAVENAINTYVSPERRNAAATEYESQMDAVTGRMSVMGMWRVCVAAGFDIKTTAGYADCRRFVTEISNNSGMAGTAINKEKCASMNGIWTNDGNGTYVCIGRDGYKLVFSKSCSTNVGQCVRVFKDLQTQTTVGKEFIYQYGKLNGLDFTCHNMDVKPKWVGQDYIQCSAKSTPYHFEFDDLAQSVGTKSMASENAAMCAMFGGTHVGTDDNWFSCDMPRDKCTQMLAFATSIGHYGMYSGYCRLNVTPRAESTVGLHTIDGIDSRIFYNLGIQSRSDTIVRQAEEYLRTMPATKNATSIHCGPSFKEYNNASLDRDWILTCTVDSKTVDFIIDDVTEHDNATAAASTAGMNCIIYGGEYKGKKCTYINATECENLDAFLKSHGSPKGATFDPKTRACMLGDAVAKAARDSAVNYIVGAVVAVGGTIVVIGSGGMATPALIGGAEILLTDVGINLAIDLNDKRLDRRAANRFNDFIDDAKKCSDEKCAISALRRHWASLQAVSDELNSDDLAELDKTLDDLFGLIQTEFVACGADANGNTVVASPADCAMQQSTLRAIDYVDMASTPVLIIGSLVYMPGRISARFIRGRNIKPVAKKISDITDVTTGWKDKDKRFYDAWKKYAPHDQSLNDFRNMFDNDLDKMTEMTRDWKTWDEINASQLSARDEIYNKIRKLNEQINLETKLGNTAEQKRLSAELKNAYSDATQLEYITPGNYSTYNGGGKKVVGDYSQMHKTATDAALELEIKVRNDYQPINQQIGDDFVAGKITYSEYEQKIKKTYDDMQSDIAELNRVYNETIDNAKKISNEKLNAVMPMQTQNFVAAERARIYSDVLVDNPELFATAKRFNELSESEKIAFGQKVLDKANATDNLAPIPLKTKAEYHGDWNQEWGALNSPSDRTIYINPDKYPDAESFVAALAHEQGHYIDNFYADFGALGHERSYNGTIIYSNKETGGYHIAPTEISSYTIEPEVKRTLNEVMAIGDDVPRAAKTATTLDAITTVGNIRAVPAANAIENLDETKDKK